ncbi:histidinol-phosphatase [Antarcticimicrobium luteum]|uniref:Histidinol-phosphatase n=2 Tax=Antarcticimicrobium luteum TaxID=2547397 RepID=A0A4R5VFU9_9RHOB|nr:histidinol-phosphatase [Antarcticimicrobium luteum]
MQSPSIPLEPEMLARFADELADVTDAMAMSYFRKPLDVERKADQSPVTLADRAIEAKMRERIAQKFPAHGILGEEHENTRLESAHIWVLDPIDGTKSFISGMPTFGTLIACLSDGAPELGVISIPPTGERWMGLHDKPTTLNGTPCHTSGRTRLADATLYTTTPDTFDAAGSGKFEALSGQVGMRRFGGDCYAYGLLASGHVDLVFEMGLHPYDYMALVPVIEGAGGVITDWQGGPLGLHSDGHVIAAASAALHQEALAALS